MLMCTYNGGVKPIMYCMKPKLSEVAKEASPLEINPHNNSFVPLLPYPKWSSSPKTLA